MPSLLQQSLAVLRVPANQLAFAVRNGVRWSRGVVSPVRRDGRREAEPLPWLAGAEHEAARDRVASIEARYPLAELRAAASDLIYAENLALLDRLDELARPLSSPVGTERSVQAVDVGCGVFQYATGLQRWLARNGDGPPRRVTLRGVEIDGFGIYRDGHSRADHARGHAALVGPGTSFEVADFRRLALDDQDVVTMFYPFLSAYPLLRWGSPLTHFGPRRLLAAAVRALRPGGMLVVANQTEGEFGRLQDLLADRPVELVRSVSFASDLVPYAPRTAGRVGSIWRRRD